MGDEKLKASNAYNVGRILVADDEETNQRLFRAALESEGHCVLLAADGAEALEKALSENPDVILLDVTMPKLDGFEVCRRLKRDARVAHVPVLMITALSTQSDRLTGIQAGANDFLIKPIDLCELRLRVRNAVYQQYLYNELQARYQELKEMAELRESLTNMIEADTQAFSSLMNQKTEQPTEEDTHGAH